MAKSIQKAGTLKRFLFFFKNIFVHHLDLVFFIGIAGVLFFIAKNHLLNLFCLNDITVLGRTRTTRESILAVVQSGSKNSVFSYVPDTIRQQLTSLPWIHKAKVYRSLCGRLFLYLTEKEPIAIYKTFEKKRYLIDQTGNLINAPIPNDLKRLPVVSGQDANQQASEFLIQIQKFPSVRLHLTAMAWIQKRRWDLQLDRKVIVQMPEENVSEALSTLSILIQEGKISSGDIVKIDLRLGNKIALSLSQTGKMSMLKI